MTPPTFLLDSGALIAFEKNKRGSSCCSTKRLERASSVRKAGEALATLKSATVIDAIVVASAFVRDAHVVTSDPDDLRPIAAHLGALPLIAI